MRCCCMVFLFLLLPGCNQKIAGNVSSVTLSVERMSKNIALLSSNDFEGRAPFTKSETKTINFIKDQFVAAGLSAANHDSFFQEVSMVQLTNKSHSSLILSHDDKDIEWKYREDSLSWSTRVVEEIEINNSELVFVGFGIVAPEYGRNDYAGIDVKGKTVVMFVNDPGYYTKSPEYFKGSAMTYYGRWTYKYEEAARQGAAAVLLIHETGAAAYGWSVIQSWARPHFHLMSEDKNMQNVAIEAWISSAAAETLFDEAGMSLEAALKSALDVNFKPEVLDGFTISGKVSNDIVQSKSYNVVGFLPGSKRPEEVIIYMGHWDHLGINTALEGDQIYNGAVDNATGIATLIELANTFTSLDKKPERSIVFLAVTAEESDLLGSEYYTENPLFPLSKTVAAINIDAMHPIGVADDVVVIGFGSSQLEDYLDKHAKTQGRYLAAEGSPEKGIFYRSDHFNFAKKGVPALYTDSGVQIRNKEKGYGAKMIAEYTRLRYHAPSDEYHESWDLSGIVSDAELYFLLGKDLANSKDFPNWYEGNEFRSARDAMMK